MRVSKKTDRLIGVFSVALTRNAADDGFDVYVTGESFGGEHRGTADLIRRCIVDALTEFSQGHINTGNHSTTH